MANDPVYDKPRWRDRFRARFNLFRDKKLEYDPGPYYSPGLSYSADSDSRGSGVRLDRTILTAIYNRLAVDVASCTVEHVRTDLNGSYLETMTSGLNECLTVESNIDQTANDFFIDLALTMFESGVAAVVPVDTDYDIEQRLTTDIRSMRVGTVSEWLPREVLIDVYNDHTGMMENIRLPKTSVALVVNPFYSVMNATGSLLGRIKDKMRQLDQVDEIASSNKMNMIIQLPYVVKSETQRNQAEERRQDLERQLTRSRFGIAYADGTEKIVQLNRPLESNIQPQIEYLTKQLLGELGLTEEILNGTATEEAMLNYYVRTINPVLDAICSEFTRKFLTKTARTQLQTIRYYRAPFAMATAEQIANLADRLTRNEVLSSNEVRGIIGFKPVDDPRADELRNKNLNPSEYELMEPVLTTDEGDGEVSNEEGGEYGEVE